MSWQHIVMIVWMALEILFAVGTIGQTIERTPKLAVYTVGTWMVLIILLVWGQ